MCWHITNVSCSACRKRVRPFSLSHTNMHANNMERAAASVYQLRSVVSRSGGVRLQSVCVCVGTCALVCVPVRPLKACKKKTFTDVRRERVNCSLEIIKSDSKEKQFGAFKNNLTTRCASCVCFVCVYARYEKKKNANMIKSTRVHMPPHVIYIAT